jgi:hypothetical protein
MIIFGSKWMIYSCILSLTVGVAIVSPLLILNTQIDPFPENPQVHPNPQSQVGQIAVNIKSVRFQLGTVNPYTDSKSNGAYTLPVFNEKTAVSATKYLNSNEGIPDAEADYFIMQFSTENGTLITSSLLKVGTAYNQSFTHGQQNLLEINPINQNISNYGGAFFFKWSIGTTQTSSEGFGCSIEPDLAALIDSSQTLTLSLTRIGTVTVKDGIATASFTNTEFIENVTLTRSDNTFTYIR